MAFIDTAPEKDAPEAAGEMFAEAERGHGYVPNMVKAFGHRPGVLAHWTALLGGIKDNMDARRYELVTLAAARALSSSYCMLAHGCVLLEQFYDRDELLSIARDYRACELEETDRLIMEFAELVALDATAVTGEDVGALRARGLSDAEIFDVAAAAAARCFFSKTLDALGVRPDARYRELDEELRRTLTVGRPIEGRD